MKRRIFTFFSLLSLVLLMATVVMWLRRDVIWTLGNLTQTHFEFCYSQSNHGFIIYTDGGLSIDYHGSAWVSYSDDDDASNAVASSFRNLVSDGFIQRLAKPLSGYPAGTLVDWKIYVNDWFLCLLFAILPAWSTIALIRHHRKSSSGFPVITRFSPAPTKPQKIP